MVSWRDQLPKSSYTFSGHDWEELADCFGLSLEDAELDSSDADEKALAQKIQNKIYGAVFLDEIRDIQVLANVVEFLNQYKKHCGEDEERIVDAMLDIEHPHTFVVWICNNVRLFWN